jgi:choice-of-anchor B domain-containing protein
MLKSVFTGLNRLESFNFVPIMKFKQMGVRKRIVWLGVMAVMAVSCKGLLAQVAFNMNLLGQWDDPNLILFGGQKYNDCWGYEAGGREYAIIGSMRKTHFIDITDAPLLTEVAAIEAPTAFSSYWRDYKTYGHYAYGVADQGGSTEGLLVFDLSNLPNSVSLVHQNNVAFQRAHNIYIDEQHGRLYIAGSNTRSNGVIIFDLTGNPAEPEVIGDVQLQGGYIHDLHVRNHIAYCSHGTSGGLRVHNLSNPQLPIQLGTLTNYIDAGYNHSSWLTSDGRHLAFCDENFGKTVKFANVENFAGMFVVDTFRSALLAPTHVNSIAHNPFIHGDYLYIAYYHDGLQIYDISDPNNIFRVAGYDTYPDNTSYSGFFGAWGTYPFFTSGKIIASDMNYGLFVLEIEDSFLPLSWISFDGRPTSSFIQLEWEYQTSSKSYTLSLEKQIQGRWETLQVYAQDQPIEGTKLRQEYLDKTPDAGVNYYRLKAIGGIDEVEYSPLLAVNWNAPTEVGYKVYPTIANSGAPVQIETLGSGGNPEYIQLLDASGKIVHTFATQSSRDRTMTISLPTHLSPGLYIITIHCTRQEQPFVHRIKVR